MLRVLLAAIGVVAALSAPAEPASAQTRTFVDDAGREVHVPATFDRVLAAGPPASVMLYALSPERMVGWITEFSEEAKVFVAEPYRDLPALGRLTGRGNTANLETVLAADPDLVLDIGTVDDTYASLADRVQEQTGIPYVLIGGRFDDTPVTIRKVGDLLGASEDATTLAEYAEGVMARIAATVAEVPEGERPRVYYGRGPEGLETGLAGSINTEILAAVGAVNVAEAAGEGGLTEVSLEQVLSWDPEVVLVRDVAIRETILADPLWAEVQAVREGRVFAVPSQPYGWFDAPPGINRLIGASWLCTILYGDRTVAELRDEVRAFYELFYHVDISEDDMDRLLASAVPEP